MKNAFEKGLRRVVEVVTNPYVVLPALIVAGLLAINKGGVENNVFLIVSGAIPLVVVALASGYYSKIMDNPDFML